MASTMLQSLAVQAEYSCTLFWLFLLQWVGGMRRVSRENALGSAAQVEKPISIPFSLYSNFVVEDGSWVRCQPGLSRLCAHTVRWERAAYSRMQPQSGRHWSSQVHVSSCVPCDNRGWDGPWTSCRLWGTTKKQAAAAADRESGSQAHVTRNQA